MTAEPIRASVRETDRSPYIVHTVNVSRQRRPGRRNRGRPLFITVGPISLRLSCRQAYALADRIVDALEGEPDAR